MKPHLTLDIRALPSYRFGHRSPLWWGTLSFIVIEGLGFVFAIAAYFYLQNQNPDWPLGRHPGLLWSSLFTVLLLLSEIPNTWTKRAAVAQDLGRVRIGLMMMSAVALLAIVIRVAEFTTLNVWWDSNAYGSALWVLLGLHTAHLLTDAFETFVMAALAYIGPLDARRFPEVEDNQAYWDFVVLAWIPIYITMYWAPRWAAGAVL
jgi:heme/copper-type cytochrome/quinol oxidase subunit 3